MPMQIEFRDARLKEQCETAKLAQKAWGAAATRQLVKRLGQLQASESLHVFAQIAPQTHPHPLENRKGHRGGQYALKIHGGLRLIFQPLNPPEDYETPSGPDWRRITGIQVLEVKDYHDE